MERRALACTSPPRSEGSRHGLCRLSMCECSYMPGWHRGKSPNMVKGRRPRSEESIPQPFAAPSCSSPHGRSAAREKETGFAIWALSALCSEQWAGEWQMNTNEELEHK